VLKGFKDFLMRGNVVDLAVAVVIGAAFTAIITALVENILTPLIAAIAGSPDITGVGNFTLNGADFSVGRVLQAILNFIVVAGAVYFVIVMPVNRLAVMRKQGEEREPEAPSEEVLLLTQIRDLLGGASTTMVGPPGDGATDAPANPTVPPTDSTSARGARSLSPTGLTLSSVSRVGTPRNRATPESGREGRLSGRAATVPSCSIT